MQIRKKPFITIVIPTRDRPDFVDINLFFLEKQTFKDFEIVISDNFVNNSCKDIVGKYNNLEIKYLKPEKDLNMSENWEYALSFAEGEYICYLQDKMFFYPQSLEYLNYCILKENYPDIADFNWDYFNLKDEGVSLAGYLNKSNKTNKIEVLDKKKEILKKFALDNEKAYQDKEGTPGTGKILSAAIKRELVEKIIKINEFYFNYINPDYGPNIMALYYSKKIIKIDKNLSIMIPFRVLETNGSYTYYDKLKKFILASNNGIKIIQKAPVANVFGSASNMVMAEYIYVSEKLGISWRENVNYEKVLNIIKKEQSMLIYDNSETKLKEFNEIDKHIKKCIYIRNKLEEKNSLIEKIKLFLKKILPNRIYDFYQIKITKRKVIVEDLKSEFAKIKL